MNNSKSTGKIIIALLAVVSVVLIAVFVCKAMGVFGSADDADSNDDVANYGLVEDEGNTVSDGSIISSDNSTIEMDEIPSNADAYSDEAEN